MRKTVGEGGREPLAMVLLVSSLSGVLELLTGNDFLDNVGNICNQ